MTTETETTSGREQIQQTNQDAPPNGQTQISPDKPGIKSEIDKLKLDDFYHYMEKIEQHSESFFKKPVDLWPHDPTVPRRPQDEDETLS